nr:hypothetical protein GCM10020093_027480 [Planobispora longispora]
MQARQQQGGARRAGQEARGDRVGGQIGAVAEAVAGHGQPGDALAGLQRHLLVDGHAECGGGPQQHEHDAAVTALRGVRGPAEAAADRAHGADDPVGGRQGLRLESLLAQRPPRLGERDDRAGQAVVEDGSA